MGTFEEVKADLKEAIGTVVYGVMMIHDYQPYEMMPVLKEIMEEIEYPKDFFSEFKENSEQAEKNKNVS